MSEWKAKRFWKTAEVEVLPGIKMFEVGGHSDGVALIVLEDLHKVLPATAATPELATVPLQEAVAEQVLMEEKVV